MPAAEADVRSAVLDASVAVRWVVPERGSVEAADLLTRDIAWLAPHLMFVEAASALRRKTAAAEIRAEIAAQALDALLQASRDGVIAVANDREIAPSALLLALSLGHKVPDCLYLALAEREGAGLATADARLASLARRRGVSVLFVSNT
jgi:predicted nucleic acid-binding protein